MLQIVMLGQLELNQKLQSPELKQLNQRIAIRHQLLPLSRTEMESYIYQRLMVAGAQGNITFSRSAFNEIYGFSKGIPRLINLLCDRALLGGFVDQTDHINKRIVKKARASLLGNEVRQPSSRFSPFLARAISWRIALLVISLLLLAGITLKGLPTQTAKNLFTEKIHGIYLQISGIPEQPAPKMEPPRQTEEPDHTFYWSQYPIPEDQRIHSETPGPLGTVIEVKNK
jgi:general secretion pathway protein A